MFHFRNQRVWALLAGAALVAQVMPKGLCQACDQPCCGREAGGHGSTTANASVESAGLCPACAAATVVQATEPIERPCHCQLKARHNQPLALSRATLPSLADGAVSIGPAILQPVAPQVLGVSREYLAASLAIPIRPPRILFGVWRN